MVPRPSVWIAANTTWNVFNFRSRLIRELTQKGYAVTVLSPTDEYVTRVRALGVHHIHLEMDNSGTNPLRDTILVARLIALFRAKRPDALLTYTPKVNIYCAIAAKWTNVPVIANISGLGTGFIRGGWLTSLVKLLYRVALRHPKKVFFQNEDDRAAFIRAGVVDSVRTERLPGSGVDVARFYPQPRTGSNERFTFLLCARLLWDKGVGVFVEAARWVKKQFPNTEFCLLGFLDVQNPSAIPRAQIEQWQNEGVVHYLGVSDDVTALYAKADCVVLPSYYREGVPRTLLEAASMGLPVITTNAPGCRDAVIDRVTGFLCRPQDARDLADKMCQILLMSRDDREQMGLRGREKMISEFDERIVIERYQIAIDQILQAGQSA